MDESKQRLVVLTDVLKEHDRALSGWVVPLEKMDDFVAAIEAAAKEAGGVSYDDLDAEMFADVAALAAEREFVQARPNFDGLADA